MRNRFVIRVPVGGVKCSPAYPDGAYVKLGGWYTMDLQEAQVVGCKSRERWARIGFDLIPVMIVPVALLPSEDDPLDDPAYADVSRW